MKTLAFLGMVALVWGCGAGGDESSAQAGPGTGGAVSSVGHGPGAGGAQGGEGGSPGGGSPGGGSAPCDLAAPFAAPQPLEGLNDPVATEPGASLSPDWLTAYFSRTEQPFQEHHADIWIATRASPAVAFDAPMLLASVNTTSNERGPSISADGLTLYLTSSIAGGGGSIHALVRSATVDDFPAPSAGNVAFFSSSGTIVSDVTPFASADGMRVYFASNRSGNFELYVADLVAMTTSPVAGVATIDPEASPVLTPDELTLYFGHRESSSSPFEVWVATRADRNADFAPPTKVEELASPNGFDARQPTAISADGCTLVLAHATGGVHDVYVARKP